MITTYTIAAATIDPRNGRKPDANGMSLDGTLGEVSLSKAGRLRMRVKGHIMRLPGPGWLSGLDKGGEVRKESHKGSVFNVQLQMALSHLMLLEKQALSDGDIVLCHDGSIAMIGNNRALMTTIMSAENDYTSRALDRAAIKGVYGKAEFAL